METIDIIKKTKAAVKFIKTADAETKNRAINLMAESVISSTKEILAANMIDIENAQVSIGDEWEDDYRPSELHTEDYTVYGYELVESGLRFGFYANNARQGGGQIADLFEVSELVRIKGTLYLFAE